MTEPRPTNFKTAVRQINEVLHREWAPLGFVEGVPPDEYDAYAMQVFSRLAAGASEDEIAAYLARAEETIRGTGTSVDALKTVARRLISFQETCRNVALSRGR